MDAGMSNNLPIYPLLRPGRDIDIIIAFDASADVKTDNWLSVVDGYAKQRNIIGWPIGAGWPSDEPTSQVEQELEDALPESQDDAEEKLEHSKKDATIPKDLSYCNVWVGNIAQRTANEEPPPSKLVDQGLGQYSRSRCRHRRHLLSSNGESKGGGSGSEDIGLFEYMELCVLP